MYILLGMHKSGTTLLAGMLHHAGIDMVEDVSARSYDEGNHFERNSTRQINKMLLDCGDTVSFRVREVLPAGAPAPGIDARAREIIADLDARHQESWGFKDPRTCLTYDFWAARISGHRLILVFRDPVEVFSHYARKESGLRWADYIEILRSWYSHNSEVMRIFQANPDRSILIDFNDFMHDPAELSRLSRFVGRQIPDMRSLAMLRSVPRRTVLYRLAEMLCRRFFREDVTGLYQALRSLAVSSHSQANISARQE